MQNAERIQSASGTYCVYLKRIIEKLAATC